MPLSNSNQKDESTVNRKPFIHIKKALLLLVLVVSFFVTSVGFSLSAYAVTSDPDPVNAGCVSDAKSLIEPPQTFGIYNTGKETRTLTIKMLASKSCQSNWVSADVPKKSYLYLKDASGQQYVSYQAQVNGWNYTDRANWNLSYKACVLRSDTQQEVCTNIVQ